MKLLTENKIKLYKRKLGEYPIVYIKGDVFPFKDIIKKYKAKWNKPNNFWFWFLDKNDEKVTINKFIKPALAEIKELENLPLEIDELIKNIEEGSIAPGISKEQESEVKAKLKEFKEMLVNIEDDEEFKKIMKQLVLIKAVQGQSFTLKNAILIFLQDRNAGIVNSESNWFKYYDRDLKPGATPLAVWAPLRQGGKFKKDKGDEEEIKIDFYKKIGKKIGDKLTPSEGIKLKELTRDTFNATRFKLVPVYSEKDTKQIEGTEDQLTKAKEARKDIKWFEDNMISDEVRPVYKGLIDFAEKSALNIELVDDLGGARGVSMSGKIQILKNEGNDVGLTKTLVHEITHELLHQEYLKDKGGKSGKFYLGKNIGKDAIEQQAELSAWMFMYSFGFDVKTTSLNYTVMWGGDKDNMVQVYNTVSKVVNFLIDEVNKNIKSINEGAHTHGTYITPEKIADLTGFSKEFDELEEKEYMKENTIKLSDLFQEIIKESLNEANDIYFDTASGAADYARENAEKRGYEIDEDDWNTQITFGGKYNRLRPGEGKTHSYSIGLLKNGKPQKKALQISLYGMPSGKFELTHYIN